MNKFALILFVCLYGVNAFSQDVPRETYLLNNDWATVFHNQDTPDDFYLKQIKTEDWKTVNLPHNWDDYGGARQLLHGNLHGTAWYKKEFRVPAAAENKRFFLRFEGVGTYATVTLNGMDFGRHPGGRVSFTIDVTGAIKPGAGNTLLVKTEHPVLISDMPCVCGGCSSEWGFSEGSQPLGIYRPVVLEITDSIRIEPFGVHVWNDQEAEKVFIETEVKNYGDTVETIKISSSFNDPEGKAVFRLAEEVTLEAGQVKIIRQSAAVENPNLWSVDSPYLYTLNSRIIQEYKTIDQVTTPFGIRTVSWPVTRKDGDNRFLLNGRPMFINGICEYEHLLGQSHAFSREQVQSRVKQIKAAGFNAFRDAHQPHHLLYQTLWDESGTLFWPQFSAHIWYDTQSFREHFKQQLRQWIKERRNSPSVVMWGLQNESVLPKAFAEECCAMIRQMDPTASGQRIITTCNGGQGTDWNVVQNWSGTYGGDPYKYDEELAHPDQLLNGEYGAWRSIDLHTEGPFEPKGRSRQRSCLRSISLAFQFP
jgi:beta-galactosidase/beta-glucuronidase